MITFFLKLSLLISLKNDTFKKRSPTYSRNFFIKTVKHTQTANAISLQNQFLAFEGILIPVES